MADTAQLLLVLIHLCSSSLELSHLINTPGEGKDVLQVLAEHNGASVGAAEECVGAGRLVDGSLSMQTDYLDLKDHVPELFQKDEGVDFLIRPLRGNCPGAWMRDLRQTD